MFQTNHEGRYGIKNPPESLDAAVNKLDELLTSEEQVTAQLENSNADDFETDDQYTEWKTRAVGALGYIRTERKFLEKWVNARNAPPKKPPIARAAPKVNGATSPERWHSTQRFCMMRAIWFE